MQNRKALASVMKEPKDFYWDVRRTPWTFIWHQCDGTGGFRLFPLWNVRLEWPPGSDYNSYIENISATLSMPTAWLVFPSVLNWRTLSTKNTIVTDSPQRILTYGNITWLVRRASYDPTMTWIHCAKNRSPHIPTWTGKDSPKTTIIATRQREVSNQIKRTWLFKRGIPLRGDNMDLSLLSNTNERFDDSKLAWFALTLWNERRLS
jgi:hypothetical protein